MKKRQAGSALDSNDSEALKNLILDLKNGAVCFEKNAIQNIFEMYFSKSKNVGKYKDILTSEEVIGNS